MEHSRIHGIFLTSAGGNSSADTDKSMAARFDKAADDYFQTAILAQAAGYGKYFTMNHL